MRTTASLSPDGRRIVFPERAAQGSRLYTRLLDETAATLVPGVESAAGLDPVISPDGQWVAFVTSNAVKKAPFAGGGAVTVATAIRVRGISWGADGSLIYNHYVARALMRVPPSGGAPERLNNPSDEYPLWPQVLPDGKRVLYSTSRTGSEEHQIRVLSLATKESRLVVSDGIYGRYVESGHVLFARDNTLFAVRVDPNTLQPRGAARGDRQRYGHQPRLVQRALRRRAQRHAGLRYGPRRGAEPADGMAGAERRGGAAERPSRSLLRSGDLARRKADRVLASRHGRRRRLGV